MTRKICKSLAMGNCIRLLLAKLRYAARFTAGVFHWNFFHEMFCRFFKILNFSIAYFKKWSQNQILKRKITFIIVFPEIRYSFLKYPKILLRERIYSVTCNLSNVLPIGVAKGEGEGPQASPNWNATNDKNMTKSLLFLHFQFLLAFFAYNIHAYNSNEQ